MRLNFLPGYNDRFYILTSIHLHRLMRNGCYYFILHVKHLADGAGFGDIYQPMALRFIQAPGNSDFTMEGILTRNPLVAFHEDFVEPGKGFGIHPHANMEIISVLLQGKMNHIDSMGYKTIIEEGGVQIMSAGSGLKHEEYNIGDEEVNFLQIWIQPKLQNIDPRYQQRSFPKDKRRNQLKTILSGEEGPEHCWINQNAKLSLGQFDNAEEIVYEFNPANKCLFIFSIEGKINVDGTDVNERDAIGIWETGSVPIHCDAGAHFLIIETPVNQK